MARHSGMQLQVLGLFRSALRVAKSKDAAIAKESGVPLRETAKNYRSGDNYNFVREKFRTDAMSVNRTNFTMIEHLLRKGQKDLKLLEMMKTAAFTKVAR